jgi:hypothetical protein
MVKTEQEKANFMNTKKDKLNIVKCQPNTAVEWLVLILYVRKVLGFLFAPRPAILTEVFHDFPQFLGILR